MFEELTSTGLEIQENISQINENNENFQKSLKDGEKKLRPDNEPVKKEEDEAARKPKQVESVNPSDLNETND